MPEGATDCGSLGRSFQQIRGFPREDLSAQIPNGTFPGNNFAAVEHALRLNTPPNSWLGQLSHSSVHSRNGTVIHWNGKHGKLLSDISYAFQNGEWTVQNHPIFKEGKLPPFQRTKGRVALLSCPYANNYFHFLFDALPRLLLIGDEPWDRIIVNDERGFQSAYLHLFGIEATQRLSVARHTHFLPDELLVPSLPLPRLNQMGAISPRACQFLRTLLEHSEIKATPSSGNRRLWISRRNGRSVTNENEVAAALQDYNLQTVYLEDLTVQEQIALFRDAELIAGVHGAGLSNLVYCRPDTRVIEILPTEWSWPFFYCLSRAVKLKHEVIVAPSTPQTPDSPMKVHVPIEPLRHLLHVV